MVPVHIIVMKIKIYLKELKDSKTKAFECRICGGVYDSAAKLSIHSTVHSGAKKHKCNYCTKSFNFETSLRLHVGNYHTNDKPFLCATCGKAFAISGNLRNHERTHTGEKYFGCKFCKDCFTGPTALTRHVLRSHPKKLIIKGQSDAGKERIKIREVLALKRMKCRRSRRLNSALVGKNAVKKSNLQFKMKLRKRHRSTASQAAALTSAILTRPSRKRSIPVRFRSASPDYVAIAAAANTASKTRLKPFVLPGSMAEPNCKASSGTATSSLKPVSLIPSKSPVAIYEPVLRLTRIDDKLHSGTVPVGSSGSRLHVPLLRESMESTDQAPIFPRQKNPKTSHPMTRPFKCPIYSLEFKHKDRMEIHMKTHPCGVQKKQRADILVTNPNDSKENGHALNLNPHLVDETAITYCCGICDEEFPTPGDLRVHLRVHNIFVCSFCPRRFTSQAYVQNHIRKKHAVKIYSPQKRQTTSKGVINSSVSQQNRGEKETHSLQDSADTQAAAVTTEPPNPEFSAAAFPIAVRSDFMKGVPNRTLADGSIASPVRTEDSQHLDLTNEKTEAMPTNVPTQERTPKFGISGTNVVAVTSRAEILPLAPLDNTGVQGVPLPTGAEPVVSTEGDEDSDSECFTCDGCNIDFPTEEAAIEHLLSYHGASADAIVRHPDCRQKTGFRKWKAKLQHDSSLPESWFSPAAHILYFSYVLKLAALFTNERCANGMGFSP